MAFSVATRTDTIKDQNGNEIGWVYKTEAGEKVAYYFGPTGKNHLAEVTGPIQKDHQKTSNVA